MPVLRAPVDVIISPDTIAAYVENTVIISVMESDRVVPYATIELYGCGLGDVMQADQYGELMAILAPTERGSISLVARQSGYVPGTGKIDVR